MAENEEEPTPSEDIVVTKYKMAGDMVNGERYLKNTQTSSLKAIHSHVIQSKFDTKHHYSSIAQSGKINRTVKYVPCTKRKYSKDKLNNPSTFIAFTVVFSKSQTVAL